MKKTVPTLLLVTLLAVGVVLVYKEAQASIIACVMAESYCTVNCWGTFTLGDCWQYQGVTYCWFNCKDFYHPTCGWNDPTETQCQGDM